MSLLVLPVKLFHEAMSLIGVALNYLEACVHGNKFGMR